jgi:hypothetical protein
MGWLQEWAQERFDESVQRYDAKLEAAEKVADNAKTPAEFKAAMARLRRLEDGR